MGAYLLPARSQRLDRGYAGLRASLKLHVARSRARITQTAYLCLAPLQRISVWLTHIA